jgi:hypothetical protein
VGDPWPFAALLDDAERAARIDRVIPGYAGRRADPRDRASWRGAGHVFGLADVSALCAPDLCDVFRGVPPEPSLALDPTPFATGFVECSEPTPALAPRGRLRFAEPRLADDPGLSAWASSVSALARIVAQRRDVQLVASVPLAIPGTLADAGLLEALVQLDRSVHVDEGGVSSAFVQLVWPWLRGDTSGNLPGGVEPPEGAVLGALARSVLRSGAFHSAAGEPLRGLRGVEPELSLASRRRPVPWGDRRAAARRSLEERVTLIGDTPRGFELRSDVTTSLGESYRPAAVQRLVSMLVRAARRMGDELAFEPSGESLWAAVRRGMHSILLALWHEGALAGDSPVDAFDVRCDRSTMTQDDIDAGRAICRVSFQAAAPIERISVVLQLVGGRVSLSGEGAR